MRMIGVVRMVVSLPSWISRPDPCFPDFYGAAVGVFVAMRVGRS
jgi:hypothetical protein